MKKLSEWFFMNVPARNNQTSAAISFLRIFAGLAMIPYGYGKILKYEILAKDFFGDPIGIGMLPSLWLTIFAQLLCAIFLIIGWQTRFAALVLFINMAVATKFHFFDPFCPTMSLPVIYMGIYAFLVVVGSGNLSIDAILFKKEKNDPICVDFKPNISENVRFLYMLVGFLSAVIAFGHFVNLTATILLLIFAFACFMASVYGYCPMVAFFNRYKSKN